MNDQPKLTDNIHYQLANKIMSYVDGGIIVEVGAADPCWASPTFFMRPLEEQKRIHALRAAHELDSKEPEHNWHIISIEPNPDFVQLFKQANLPILPYAATSADVGQTTFQVSPHPMSVSALEVRYPDIYTDEQMTNITVEALTLNTMLKRHCPYLTNIDVLLVDVEGWELEVMRGLDLEYYQPKLVVLEHLTDQPLDTTALYIYMRQHGYRFVSRENENTLYIKSKT